MDNDDAMKNERCLIKKIIQFNEKIMKTCVVLIGLTFLMGFYDERNIYVELEEITVELGDKLPQEKFDYINNHLISSKFYVEDSVPKDEDGETNTLGTFGYYIVYRDEERMYSRLTNKRSTISVIDSIKPEIELKESSFKFEYGSKINVSDIAICHDLSECTLTFKDTIDTKKSGVQEITILATDEGGNVSEEKVSITIKSKPVYYSKKFVSMDNNNDTLNSNLTEEQKNSLRSAIVQYAKQFEGNPYVYGGNSLTNGIDCSGFTKAIYARYGYYLPRVAVDQGYVGKPISRAELMPGDLIVYRYANGGGHVGIYVGNGKMIHASTPKDGIKIGIIFDGSKTYRRIIY